MVKDNETLIIVEELKIMNDDGTSHDYEYRAFYDKTTRKYRLVRIAYGTKQRKNPFYDNIEEVMFAINADKSLKIRRLICEEDTWI